MKKILVLLLFFASCTPTENDFELPSGVYESIYEARALNLLSQIEYCYTGDDSSFLSMRETYSGEIHFDTDSVYWGRKKYVSDHFEYNINVLRAMHKIELPVVHMIMVSSLNKEDITRMMFALLQVFTGCSDYTRLQDLYLVDSEHDFDNTWYYLYITSTGFISTQYDENSYSISFYKQRGVFNYPEYLPQEYWDTDNISQYVVILRVPYVYSWALVRK
jgi:hypothetical protein